MQLDQGEGRSIFGCVAGAAGASVNFSSGQQRRTVAIRSPCVRRRAFTPLLGSALAAGLAGRIARVALGLLLGFERRLPDDFFFRVTLEADGFGGSGLFGEALFLGLGGFALEAGLLAARRDRFALLAALHNFGIVRSGLLAKSIGQAPSRLLRGLLPIGESGFLEASHRTSFTFGFGGDDPVTCHSNRC
jgi:hypothetical protein